MLTDAQKTAGAARLTGGHLTAADQLSLLSVFRLWLGARATMYTDLAAVLAAAASPTADVLAGVLILLQTLNFSTFGLEGGKDGVQLSDDEERELLIKYAFGLLYDLPYEQYTDVSSGAVPNVGSW